MTRGGTVPLAPVLAVALVLAGCASVPVEAPPQTTRSVESAWLVATEWDEFSQNSLWPQEWALGHWHRFRASADGLDLVPLAPLPPAPHARPRDLGGDPGVWRVDWVGAASRAQGLAVSFRPAETLGLPPSLWALRQALTQGDGRVRVVRRSFADGRFTIVVEVVRGLGD